MRCCLMACLLKILSDIAPKPTTTFSIQICQNPKLQLGPTDSFYPAPPGSYDTATARNPNSLVTPIRISVSPRWPCQLPVISCNYFSLTKIAIGLTEMAWPILCCPISSLRSHRVDAIGVTEMRFALNPSNRSHQVVPVGPIEIPNVHILN
jgi:hypothetical protein